MHLTAGASRQAQRKAYPHCFERNSRGDGMSTLKLEQNKQTVTAFYDLLFNQCQSAETVEKYVGDVYIQHNPMVANGETGVSLHTSSAWRRNTAGKPVEFRCVIAERTGTWCCTVISNGPTTQTGPGWIFFVWTRTEKSWSTGMSSSPSADICELAGAHLS